MNLADWTYELDSQTELCNYNRGIIYREFVKFRIQNTNYLLQIIQIVIYSYSNYTLFTL